MVGIAAGVAHLLSTADGSTLATAPLPGPSAGGLSARDGAVFVGTGYQPYFPGDLLVRLG